jgi:hypothetical protein
MIQHSTTIAILAKHQYAVIVQCLEKTINNMNSRNFKSSMIDIVNSSRKKQVVSEKDYRNLTNL